MKLFDECIKDAGVKSGHVVTALGNERKSNMFSGFGSESFRFGRYRSQPTKQNAKATAAEIRREEGDDQETASISGAEYIKAPDVSLDDKGDGNAAGVKRKSLLIQKAWGIPLTIKKFDVDKQLVFGWASVIEKDGKVIIDKQGDIIEVEELENAAYEFNLNSRNGGDMHDRTNVSKLVESMVFTTDKQKALGIDLGQIGWWVGFKVHDEQLWAAHKRGERPEFSIGGAAIPIAIED